MATKIMSSSASLRNMIQKGSALGGRSFLAAAKKNGFTNGVGSSCYFSTKADTMHQLFNSQITNEMNASQIYLSASIWCDDKELTGFASFMRMESTDERNHALEMIDFALKRDIPVDLEALAAPHAHWPSVEALWTDLLEAEKTNSQALYGLADAAHACQDHAVITFLQPFHSEQVEAVANMKTILAKVREESTSPGLIRQLDTQIGAESKAKGV